MNKPGCPTCLAIKFERMTVELAHCSGVAMGVAFAGDFPNDAIGARRHTESLFCREHADLIFGAARTMAAALRIAHSDCCFDDDDDEPPESGDE